MQLCTKILFGHTVVIIGIIRITRVKFTHLLHCDGEDGMRAAERAKGISHLSITETHLGR